MARLTALTSLDVHGCKLQALPLTLPPGLQQLNASGNRLAALPEGISRLQHLTHLDVSDNQLRALPSMTALTQLTRLHLGSNWHAGGSLPAALPACMPALVVLDASGIGLKVSTRGNWHVPSYMPVCVALSEGGSKRWI